MNAEKSRSGRSVGGIIALIAAPIALRLVEDVKSECLNV